MVIGWLFGPDKTCELRLLLNDMPGSLEPSSFLESQWAEHFSHLLQRSARQNPAALELGVDCS